MKFIKISSIGLHFGSSALKLLINIKHNSYKAFFLKVPKLGALTLSSLVRWIIAFSGLPFIVARWIILLLVWNSVYSGEFLAVLTLSFTLTVSCVQRLRQKV